jgi:hypothetical protein
MLEGNTHFTAIKGGTTFKEVYLDTSPCNSTHRWGVDTLLGRLGCKEPRAEGFLGLDERRVKHTPTALKFYENAADGSAILTLSFWKAEEIAKEAIPFHDIPRFKSGPRRGQVKPNHGVTGIRGAWDVSAFALRAFGETEKAVLRDMYEAFLAHDVVVSFGGRPFGIGLCFTRYSLISEDVRAHVLAEDTIRAEGKRQAALHLEALKKAGVKVNGVHAEYSENKRTYGNSTIPAGSYAFFVNARSYDGGFTGWFSALDIENYVDNRSGKIADALAAKD